MPSLKAVVLILIPIAGALAYQLAQYIAYLMTDRMYFSSTFIPELLIYIVLCAIYTHRAYKMHRATYFALAILGSLAGVIVFIVGSMELFLHFEFWRDLSI
jgi:fatty-acid desaturase